MMIIIISEKIRLKMSIKRHKEKDFSIFLLMMLLHKILFFVVCLASCYSDAAQPIDQVMEKLIKLISEEQVSK